MSNDVPNGPDDGRGSDRPGDESNEPQHGTPQNPFAGTPFEAFGFGMPGMSGMPGMPGSSGSGGFDLSMVFDQLKQLFSGQSGPVNWNVAMEVARQTVREAGDASLTAAERSSVEEAVRLAEHWLNDATSLPTGAVSTLAWNRQEWLEGTLPGWKKVIEPLASHVVTAMGKAFGPEGGSMPGLGDLGGLGGGDNADAMSEQLQGQLQGVLGQFGGAMFGGQVGQGLGKLATEVCGASDTGLPLGPQNRAALLPANIAAFGEGLEVSEDDVRIYLALRECAHQRLFAHVPWLEGHLLAAVEEYARGMQVDTSKLEEAISGIDPNNPEALQEAITGGLFEPEETPQQKAALTRLETALALVEGWVDDVVTQAAEPRMPSAASLREAVRRRRAVGGPAERIFSGLVGLQLRPRRLRDAAALWGALRQAKGDTGRDALWTHPDMLPTAEDLDDPTGFVERREASEYLDLSALGFDDLSTSEGGEAGETAAEESATAGAASDTDGDGGDAEHDIGAGNADGTGDADGTGSHDSDDPGRPGGPTG